MVNLRAEFERACSQPNQGSDFDRLAERDRILVTIWVLEGEVSNGGFDQFYCNSSGHLAVFAVEALTLIGAHQMAALVREANALFGPDGPPADRSARQDRLMALTADNEHLFDSVTNRFDDYPDDIAALLSAYLERNPS